MKILVIDDDMIARMALIDVIREVGGNPYRLVELDSGDAAWPLFQRDVVPPMLVCCDIRMPGMSGLELLEKVRALESGKRLPFVLISSSSDVDTITRAASLGVTGYIVKPFEQQEASARLGRFLALARGHSMEEPAHTVARLKINTDRYNHYLWGLRSQITQLLGDMHMATDMAHYARMNAKVEAIKKACQSLGLWRAVHLLEPVRMPVSPEAYVLEALHEIRQHIQYQTYSWVQ
ncbi:MAG: response regulator [Rhodoferax sp.]|nr:response regulator [Rhodoferax sp.]